MKNNDCIATHGQPFFNKKASPTSVRMVACGVALASNPQGPYSIPPCITPINAS